MIDMQFPVNSFDRLDTQDGLRVVHVVLALEPGGLERIVIDLVREGQSFGQSASVVCLERPGLLAPEVEGLGAPLFCAEKRPGLRPEVIGRLRTLFRIVQPHVVHTHQVGALCYAGPAARRAGVPVVVHTEHGKNYAARRRTRLLGRLAGRYAQRFYCVSGDIAEEVTSFGIVPCDKVVVVPNGIDAARFEEQGAADEVRRELKIPASAPVVGAVGRLNEIKRYDLLIRAFAQLKTCRGDAHLVFVGDGSCRRQLQELSAELLPADCVHFVGFQPSPERFLHAMDVMALTSRSEGMPLAVLEAWAARVPVVASRVGGVPELIVDEQTGLLVEFGDIAALASAIARLLAEAALAAHVRDTAHARIVARYSLEQMAANYQRQYEELYRVSCALEETSTSHSRRQRQFSR